MASYPHLDAGQPLNTFVVRLWQELGSGRSCWRGEVCHIQTGEHVAFTDEDDLLHFIRRWMRSPEYEVCPGRDGK
ncbi:hypothetical protein [Thioalkalivibrio sp.]|uniref:hypothetical protein n=1 Tax=Thioalkalivibrio sp. TaxID=2093813 RepID=UPI0039755F1D